MRLQNASQEELSDFARQELENVICQLRAQEDMQKRISGHDELLRNHKLEIDTTHTDIDKIRNSINTFEKSFQQTLDNAKLMHKSVEVLKGNVNESLDKLEEKFAKLEYNLDHKKVVPFSTSGSTNIKSTLNVLKEAIGNAELCLPYNKSILFKTNFNKWIEKVKEL